jgi:hypothetical protein
LALSALALGCEADSSELVTGLGDDAGATDSAADTGSTDTGSTDTGSADTGPVDAGPSPACASGRTFQIDANRIGPEGYEGIMVGAPTGRVGLSTANGQGIIFFDGQIPGALFSESSFYARVEIYTPFWTEARVTLWRLARDGRPGALALVAWSGASYGSGVADLLSYAYGGQGPRSVGCGAVRHGGHGARHGGLQRPQFAFRRGPAVHRYPR